MDHNKTRILWDIDMNNIKAIQIGIECIDAEIKMETNLFYHCKLQLEKDGFDMPLGRIDLYESTIKELKDAKHILQSILDRIEI